MSPVHVPSFTRKLSWAEKHLQNLERSTGKFRDRHPYRTRKVLQGKNKGNWIMEFIEPADPTWALMVGDVLYNLRSTLDYLAGDLNPSSVRSHVMFPIMHEKVWEIPFVKGENRERTDARNKWDVSTRKMHPEAVRIIKRLQPIPDERYDLYFHRLDLLNRLSNKDRHRTLHVHLTGLAGPITTTFTFINGATATVTGQPDVPEGKPGTAALQHGAIVVMPPDLPDPNLVVDVHLRGTTTQAINMGQDGRAVVIPDTLGQILDWIRNEGVAPLSPFLHGLTQ